MIRELAPGHPLDLSARVAVVGRVTAGTVAAAAAATAAATAGADALFVEDPADRDVVAAATGLAVLTVLPHDALVVPGGTSVPGTVAAVVAGVAAGTRVVVADDVATARGAADTVVAVEGARP